MYTDNQVLALFHLQTPALLVPIINIHKSNLVQRPVKPLNVITIKASCCMYGLCTCAVKYMRSTLYAQYNTLSLLKTVELRTHVMCSCIKPCVYTFFFRKRKHNLTIFILVPFYCCCSLYCTKNRSQLYIGLTVRFIQAMI